MIEHSVLAIATLQMASSPQNKRRHQRQSMRFKREFDDLIRGVCGGFLFGIPLLYTMEVWEIGSLETPPKLLGVLLATLFVTYLLSRTAGFRKAKATTEREAIGDAIEAIAIGLLCATLMLFALRQITFDTRFSGAMGKIIFESVPFTLGVALANQLLQESGDSKSDQSNPLPSDSLSERFYPEGNLNETLADIGATLVGAIVIAFSIAPTDEVTVLVAAVDGPSLLLTVLISLVISYCIVFQANFSRQGQRRLQEGLFQKPLSETIFAYLISLCAAGLMLSFFGKLDANAPLETAFHQILILGLPATIGGAAGRLVL